jgi:hypothetical protein
MRKLVIIIIILVIILILYNVYAYFSAFESAVESVWIENIDMMDNKAIINGTIIDDYLVVKEYVVEENADSINITILKGLPYFPNFSKETMLFNINFIRPENVTKILLINSWESKVLWTK